MVPVGIVVRVVLGLKLLPFSIALGLSVVLYSWRCHLVLF